MEKDIIQIKKSYEYKKIEAINNWDLYFKEMKIKLMTELEEMTRQLKEMQHGRVKQAQFKQA